MTQQPATRGRALKAVSMEVVLLACLGLVMAAVYLVTTLRLPWWRFSSRLYPWSGLLGTGIETLLICLAAGGLLMLLYLLGWRLVRRCQGRWLIWVGAIIFALILVWLLPITSDLFTYLSQAHLLTDLGLNPLQTAPLDAPADPLIQAFPTLYSTRPSVYGPAWLLFSSPGTLGQYDLATGLLYLKGLALVTFLSSAWLLERILRDTRPQAALEGLYLYAWNPFVLMMVVGEAHNDALMMALVLFSLWFLTRDRWTAAFAVLVLSVWVKWASAIYVPLYLVHVWLQQTGDRKGGVGRGAEAQRPLATMARFALVGALVSVVVLVPFALLPAESAGQETDSINRFLHPANWRSGSNPLALWGLVAGLALFGLILVGLAWKLWREGGSFQSLANAAFVSSLLLFVLGFARSQPWYLLWSATLASLSDRRWAWPVVICLSALMLATQFWVEWGTPGW